MYELLTSTVNASIDLELVIVFLSTQIKDKIDVTADKHSNGKCACADGRSIPPT